MKGEEGRRSARLIPQWGLTNSRANTHFSGDAKEPKGDQKRPSLPPEKKENQTEKAPKKKNKERGWERRSQWTKWSEGLTDLFGGT